MSSHIRWSALAGIALALMLATSPGAAATRINEIRIDQTGTDTDEYFELIGTPGASLNGLTYVVIGDSGTVATCGVIEAVIPLTGYLLQADGLFAAVDGDPGPTLTGYDAVIAGPNGINFENNDNVTHMLVSGFTGTVGQDLDTNDDGILDIKPWTAILDAVGLTTGIAPDCTGSDRIYASTVLGPDGSFVPDQVYRCSDTGEWKIGDFSPLGSTDTPGRANHTCRGPLPEVVRESREPCVPTVGQAATVTAVLRHVTGGNVLYRVNGSAQTLVHMTYTGLSGADSVFQCLIPGRPANADRVEYQVKAFNANPDTVTGFGQGYFVGTTPVSALRVNDGFGQIAYRFYGARIRGTVTVADGDFSTVDTDYYVQDMTGGVNVFKFGRHEVKPGLGDDVTLAGILDQYRGKLELSEGGPCDTMLIHVNDVGAPPDPTPVTVCNVGEAQEGMLVRMERMRLTSTDTQFPADLNSDHALVQCDPNNVIMRIDRDTDIDGMPIVSPAMDIVGVVAQFDTIPPYASAYQVMPRAYTDLTFLSPMTGVEDRTGSGGVRFEGARPNPFSNRAEIHYRIPSAPNPAGTHVRLVLVDLQGRVVATLVDRTESPGEHAVTVKPDLLERVGSGLHFYRLEMNGRTYTQKAVRLR
jgi:hypothetical protein